MRQEKSWIWKCRKAFAAITDPGSGLEKLRDLKFGKIFLNDPDIGDAIQLYHSSGLYCCACWINIRSFGISKL
jgi:hypothetical protein